MTAAAAACLLAACNAETGCSLAGAVPSSIEVNAEALNLPRPAAGVRMCAAGRCGETEPLGQYRTVTFAGLLGSAPIGLTTRPVVSEFRFYGRDGTLLSVARGSVIGVQEVVEPNGPGCGEETILTAEIVIAPDGRTYKQVR